MAIDWLYEPENLIIFNVTGKLGKAEFDTAQKECEPLIQKHGAMHLLVILSDFEGWESTTGWDDTSFSDRNDKFIKKMAIVGEPEWQDSIYMFTAPDLRSLSIKYFLSGEEAAARQWLMS